MPLSRSLPTTGSLAQLRLLRQTRSCTPHTANRHSSWKASTHSANPTTPTDAYPSKSPPSFGLPSRRGPFKILSKKLDISVEPKAEPKKGRMNFIRNGGAVRAKMTTQEELFVKQKERGGKSDFSVETKKRRMQFIGHRAANAREGGAVRAKMMEQEELLIKQKNSATIPEVVLGVQPAANDLGMTDDMDDGMGLQNVHEIGEGFAGYKRISKGDLCELRSAGGLVDMGIFIRETKGQPTGDFLTSHGMVKKLFSARVSFSIPGYLKPEVVDDFISYYERVEQFELARGAPIGHHGVVSSRGVTTPLLEPVRKFVYEARRAHSLRHTHLKKLYDLLAHETETKRVTTQEAAAMAFDEPIKPTELYATHMTLMSDGLRFLGDKGFHRITSKFRIRSKQDLRVVDDVTAWVRKSSVTFDSKGHGTSPAGPLGEFVEKAKHLIDRSRSLQAITPETLGALVERIEIPDMQWSESDRKFIDFMMARMKTYGLQQTPIEGLVPYILRQTCRYEDRKLDAGCTYDFLAEIGVFSPWENMALHQENQNLPGYGVSKQADIEEARLALLQDSPFKELGLEDSMASLRKDWGDMRVFCIDDASAKEIDDGFSVEKVSENETWVHVHIANPTAFLPPDHWISEIASNRVTTKYLDPHVFRMLPRAVSDALGVSNGAPVFTFSSKIDNDGRILDFTVQPGTVRNVRRLTYGQLSQELDLKIVDKLVITTGKFPTSSSSPSSSTESLSAEDLDLLRHLRKCSLDLMRRRVRDGMIALQNVVYSYNVSSDITSLSSGKDLQSPIPIVYRGFPSVQLIVDKEAQYLGAGDVVAEFMILANSIIVKYAQKHNIPLPYRSLDYNNSRPDVVNYFMHNIMPTRNEFGVSEKRVVDDLTVYMSVGFSNLSTQAGPHRLMGLPDGYTKGTSPLRRYSDMMVHWNLQAHIMGKPPPFSETKLTAMLIDVDLKERMANFGSNETRRFWASACIHRLLREGGDAERQLPETMLMTMTEIKNWPTPSVGFVKELANMCKVNFKSGTEAAAIKSGDQVAVSALEARMGERTIMFESKGLVARHNLLMG